MKFDELALPDKEFLKWSHISEKWLYDYLVQNAQDMDMPEEEFLEIIDDERRHTQIFKNLLQVFKIDAYDDPKQSFHYSIYTQLAGVDWLKLSKNEKKAMLAISERRAVFLYKAYIKNGQNEQIKKTLKTVLKDELRHARTYLDESDPAFQWAKNIDKKVWTYLERKYGDKAQQENLFWSDLKKNQLFTKCN